MTKTLALCLAAATAVPNLPVLAQAPPAPPIVTTTGEAVVRTAPDEVTFQIELRTEGADLTGAKAANAALADTAIQYLRSEGVAERDIQTRYLSVNVEYRDYRERSDPRYVAAQTIGVLLRDVDSFERINTGLLQRGITGLSGPNFGTSEREALLLEARTAAVKDARVKAETMARALDQTIGSAYRIEDVRSDRGRVEYLTVSARDIDASGGGGEGVALGEVELRHYVTVSFYLRE